MTELHAVMGRFATEEQLVLAVHGAKSAGYCYDTMDAYSPYPVEGLADFLGQKVWRLQRYLMLMGGIVGALCGYALPYFVSVISYPLNVGGRPYHSWPAFIPITFEMTVLFSALTGFAAFLIMNGFPMLHHPVFNVDEFECCTDKFYLALKAGEGFDRTHAAAVLRELNAEEVYDVE